jgi:hypothetical protein
VLRVCEGSFVPEFDRMVAVTLSLARSDDEAALLARSLAVLAGGVDVLMVTDGGSEARFLQTIGMLPRTHVLTASGLVPQVKRSVGTAVASGAARMLYTEPDKLAFFKTQLSGVRECWDSMPADALVVFARSDHALATFPERQRQNEARFNQECGDAFGIPGDYCYGPFVLPRQVAATVAGCPDDLGWGWRPYAFALAHRLGCRLLMVTGDFECPPDQRVEGPADDAYRDRQLAQNRRGLRLGLDAPLPMSR